MDQREMHRLARAVGFKRDWSDLKDVAITVGVVVALWTGSAVVLVLIAKLVSVMVSVLW